MAASSLFRLTASGLPHSSLGTWTEMYCTASCPHTPETFFSSANWSVMRSVWAASATAPGVLRLLSELWSAAALGPAGCTAAPCQQQGRSQHQRPYAKGPPGTAVFCLLHRVLLSLLPLFLRVGLRALGCSPHLQFVPSCAIFIDRTLLRSLRYFVHNNGHTAPGMGNLLSVLYHTQEKIAPLKNPFLGGNLKINFGDFEPSP